MEEIKKEMTDEELQSFVERIGRTELYAELSDIQTIKSGAVSNKDLKSLNIFKGTKSAYLKAVQVTMIELGYDEKWVYSKVADALEKKYSC